MNTDIVVILGWMTSQLQRLVVRVNKPFKHLLRQLLTEDCALTPTGITKKPSVTSLAVDQNSMAVHLTGSDCEGFQKCHISSKWVEDGNVSSMCEED
jgi:hypothetical protein